jgi:hypothetical protein
MEPWTKMGLKTASRVETGSLDRRPQDRCDSVIVNAAIISIRMVPSSVEGTWAIMSLCSTPYKLLRVEGRDSRVDVQPCGSCGVRLKLCETLIHLLSHLESVRAQYFVNAESITSCGCMSAIRIMKPSTRFLFQYELTRSRIEVEVSPCRRILWQSLLVGPLGGVGLSRKAEGKYEVPWSVMGQRAAGGGRTSPFPLPRQDRPAATKEKPRKAGASTQRG